MIIIKEEYISPDLFYFVNLTSSSLIPNRPDITALVKHQFTYLFIYIHSNVREK